MWAGPPNNSRFHPHQSVRSDNNSLNSEQNNTENMYYNHNNYVRRGGRGRGNRVRGRMRRGRGNRGRGRGNRGRARKRGRGRSRGRGRYTTPASVTPIAPHREHTIANDDSRMRYIQTNPNIHAWSDQAQAQAQAQTQAQAPGRGRGGLPNQTTQNIRKSGYGYVGATSPLPFDLYKKSLARSPSEEMYDEFEEEFEEERTTQSKYRKRVSDSADTDSAETVAENEILIRGTGGNVKQYVQYALELLEGGDATAKHELVKLSARGRAIGKAVDCCEIIKRRVYGLHQVTRILTQTISEVWEPLENGLNEVTVETSVSGVQILLSLSPALLDVSDIGYQEPISWIDLGDARQYLNRMQDAEGKMKELQVKYDNKKIQMKAMENKYKILSMRGKLQSQQERQDLNTQTLLYNQQTLDYRQQKSDFDAQTVSYHAQTLDYNAQTTRLNAQTKEFDEQASRIQQQNVRYDDLKERFDDLKCSIDNPKSKSKPEYESWDSQQITKFIISIDEERYIQYEEDLSLGLSAEGIDGSCLAELTKEDLHRLGITQFKDKRDIHNAISRFTQM